MAAKKAPKSKVEEAVVEAEVAPAPSKEKESKVHRSNVSKEGTLKLNDSERFKLNWEGAEMRAAANALKLKLMEYDVYSKKVDPAGTLRKLMSELNALTDAHKACERKFIESSRTVAAKLQIDPTHKWSYDDETGVVHMETTSSSAAPAATASAPAKK